MLFSARSAFTIVTILQNNTQFGRVGAPVGMGQPAWIVGEEDICVKFANEKNQPAPHSPEVTVGCIMSIIVEAKLKNLQLKLVYVWRNWVQLNFLGPPSPGYGGTL